jgi:hypothetical protein
MAWAINVKLLIELISKQAIYHSNFYLQSYQTALLISASPAKSSTISK